MHVRSILTTTGITGMGDTQQYHGQIQPITRSRSTVEVLQKGSSQVSTFYVVDLDLEEDRIEPMLFLS